MTLFLMLVGILLIFLKNQSGYCLSCTDIIEAGSGAKLENVDFQSLASLSPADIQPCLVLLGKDTLKPVQAQTLWKVLVKIYGSANEIPENNLKLLGWVISGIPPSDFYNLTFTEVDTIAAFGQYRNLSTSQLSALYEKVTYFWSYKNEDDLSSYDLATLKQILCAFNASYIQYIHPDAYRDAASELATLQDCPKDVMSALAKLATDESAFGNPKEWTANKVSLVGCVLSGLSNVRIIPAEAMRGVTPEIKRCLPSSTIQAMTKEQLSEMYLDAGNIKKTESPQSFQRSTNQNFYNNNESKGNNDTWHDLNLNFSNPYSNKTLIKNEANVFKRNYLLVYLMICINLIVYYCYFCY